MPPSATNQARSYFLQNNNSRDNFYSGQECADTSLQPAAKAVEERLIIIAYLPHFQPSQCPPWFWSRQDISD